MFTDLPDKTLLWEPAMSMAWAQGLSLLPPACVVYNKVCISQ